MHRETRCPRLWKSMAAGRHDEDGVDSRACVTRVPHVISVDVLEARRHRFIGTIIVIVDHRAGSSADAVHVADVL